MWKLIVIEIFSVIFLNAESLLLKLQRHCVPTSSVRGPCHVCVCNAEGIFDCHTIACENQIVNPLISSKDECEPHMAYKYEELHCTCSYKRKWMSFNCRETFQYLRPNNTVARNSLRSNITCTPKALFLIDCNICRYDDAGIINPNLCTNRSCGYGHKADICKFGDFLRTKNEICICSDINYYVDRLCVKIEGGEVQEVKKDHISKITNIKQTRKNMVNDNCIPYKEYKIDCNNCICDSNSLLVCTNKTCSSKNKENVYRDFFEIPRVENERETCIPGQKYRLKCNSCICTDKKTLSCTTNLTNNALPIIKEGDSCVPGKIYKILCNTCQCGDNNNLICTKMACLESSILNEIKALKNDLTRRGNRRQNEQKHRNVTPFPNVPKGDCVPGKAYSLDACRICFCNDKKQLACTKFCLKTPFRGIIEEYEISQIETRSIVDLPELPHMGAECEPGKSYYVACNLCLCSDARGLLCTKKYCLSTNRIVKQRTLKFQGMTCQKDFKEGCITCKCVNKKSDCKITKPCNTSYKKLLSSDTKIKLTLDVKKDKCEPNATYRVHCNECYCQPEGGLRCTQKICLTFPQTKQLKERQNYLEKYGL